MPLDCVIHGYLILGPLTSSQRGSHLISPPDLLPHRVTFQVAASRQPRVYASEWIIQAGPVWGCSLLITRTRSRCSDVAQPRTSWVVQSRKIQTSIHRIHTQEEWTCRSVWVNHTQLQSTCLTAAFASTFAGLTQTKLVAGIDLCRTLALCTYE